MPALVTRLDLRGSPQQPAHWRAADRSGDRLALVQIVGPYRSARRCIDPPRLELSVVDGAASYEVVVAPAHRAESAWSVRTGERRVDLAPVWPQLPYGSLQITSLCYPSFIDLFLTGAEHGANEEVGG